MKVYIIQKGEYSGRHICAVSDSYEKALEIAKLFREYDDDGKEFIYDRPTIEEWDTETFIPLTQNYKLFCCIDRDNNESVEISEEDVSYSFYEEIGIIIKKSSCGHYYYIAYIMAENQDIARKIFLDKLAEFKAKEQGI